MHGPGPHAHGQTLSSSRAQLPVRHAHPPAAGRSQQFMRSHRRGSEARASFVPQMHSVAQSVRLMQLHLPHRRTLSPPAGRSLGSRAPHPPHSRRLRANLRALQSALHKEASVKALSTRQLRGRGLGPRSKAGAQRRGSEAMSNSSGSRSQSRPSSGQQIL